MSALAYLIGALIFALPWLAFRRKRVADHVEEFNHRVAALLCAGAMDESGYDCFIEKVAANRWQVRCYRRKEKA